MYIYQLAGNNPINEFSVVSWMLTRSAPICRQKSLAEAQLMPILPSGFQDCRNQLVIGVNDKINLNIISA